MHTFLFIKKNHKITFSKTFIILLQQGFPGTKLGSSLELFSEGVTIILTLKSTP